MSTVYLLIRVIPYEDSEVLGVFTTRDLASEAFTSYTKQEVIKFGTTNTVGFEKLDYMIEPHVLNHQDF